MVGSGIYEEFDANAPPRPVQLIRILPSGKIQIDQTALDIIANADTPVGFCCIAGKYRTGKSFLLNRLLKLEDNGFRVDPSISACTEGIWMWSKPLTNERQGNCIFFLDTEGSASLVRNSTNDAKIFTLANLIASYLIFNSVGAIDEKSISQLNVVTQLSKNIILEQDSNLQNNEENLYRYMPKFLWVIRDFTLELPHVNGRRIKPNQYLEDVLFSQNNEIKVNQNTRKIRRALTKYYKDRDCVVLVRPAYQQDDLQNLNNIPEHKLRRDFIDGINDLRDKIVKNTGPKMYDNSPLFGGSITSMIQSYVNMMNNGAIPSIRSAWQQISEDEGVYAYEAALKKFNQLYKQNFQQDKPKGQQIFTLLKVISQSTLDQFHKNLTQNNQLYQNKLKQYLGSKQQAILQVNKQLIQIKNVQILKQCMGPIIEKIQANAYANNPEQVNNDIKEASQRFNQQAKGQNKGQILSEFLITINPIILNLSTKNKSNQNQEKQTQRLRKQYQDQMKVLRKQVDVLKSQVQDAKNQNQVLKSNQKTNQKPDSQDPVLPPKPKPKSQKKQIKQTKGCCGRKSKKGQKGQKEQKEQKGGCLIM